jgi:hypothetical protein
VEPGRFFGGKPVAFWRNKQKPNGCRQAAVPAPDDEFNEDLSVAFGSRPALVMCGPTAVLA